MRFSQKVPVLAILAVFCLNASLSAAPLPAFFVTNGIPVPDDLSQAKGNEIDPAIAICPLNTTNLNASNMFVASFSDASPGIFTAYSTNRGLTWGTNIIATNGDTHFVPASGEPTVAWDAYGNLFLAYIPATSEGVAVCVSTNAGKTFSPMTNLFSNDATEQPRLVSAPTGPGAGALWLVYKDYSVLNFPLVMQGLQSTGLGTNGTFGPVQTVPNSSDGGFADITVGPAGQVLIVFQNNVVLPGTSFIYVTVNTNAFGPGQFSAPVAATADAIGGFTYIAAENTGIGVNAAPGVAWDVNSNSVYYGRVYLTYTAEGANGNLIIASRYSTDFGTIWSPESQVDDDLAGSNDHFFPRVAVDAATGVLAYSWFDCRNDMGSSSPTISHTTNATFVFKNFVATNVTINVLANPANGTVSYTATDNSGMGTDYSISVTANDVYGILLGTNGMTGTPVTNVISIYSSTNAGGTNILVYIVGTNTSAGPPTTNTTVHFSLTDSFPNSFTSGGAGNADPEIYTTVSTNGAMAFLPNQPLIPATATIPYPALGVVSDVTRSTSLLGYGHYTGLAFSEGVFFPVWPDNSDLTGNNPDLTTNFDLCTAEVVVPTADLSVYLTNTSSPVISGGAINYNLIVSNNGPFAVTGFVVTNYLPANIAFEFAKPSLGGSYTYNPATSMLIFTWSNLTLAPLMSLTNQIFAQANYGEFVTNIATVSAPLPDAVPVNNIYISTVMLEGEDLSLGMELSTNSAIDGVAVTNTITIENLGPADNGVVLVTNSYSTNWTNITVLQSPGPYSIAYNTNGSNIISFNLGLMASNASAIIEIAASPFGPATNSAISAAVSSLDFDDDLTNNSTNVVLPVGGEDLSVSMGISPSNIYIGETVTNTITVVNEGPAADGIILLTNSYSTNWSSLTVVQPPGGYVIALNTNGSNVISFNLGPLPANQATNIIVTGVPSGRATNSFIAVAVSSQDYDTNLANNYASLGQRVYGEDMATAIFASATNVNIGDTITFTINVTNIGLASAGDVLLTNILTGNLGQVNFLQFPPQGSGSLSGNVLVFDLGQVPAGTGFNLIYTAVALSAGTAPTLATNIVMVTNSLPDTNLVNNTARAVIHINGEDLAVGGFASPPSVPTNQAITYTVLVTNLGPSSTGVISLTNTLSTNLTGITVQQNTGTYSIVGNKLISHPGLLAVGQTATLVFTAIPVSLGTASDMIGSGSTDFDTNLVNNTAELDASVVLLPTLVSNFTVTAFASSALFSWMTPYNATVQVAYGLTPSLGSTTSLSGPDTNHAVLLTGLARDTNYYFSAMSWQNGIYYATNGTFSTVDTIILNTQDAAYSNFWSEGSPALPGIYGVYFNDAGTSTNVTCTATYTPTILTPGLYNVFAWYPQSTAFTTNAQITVYGATNAVARSINQTSNGGAWLPLATNVDFASGTNGDAVIYNNTGETNKLIAANAMMWQYASSQDYTAGSVPAWWASIYFGTNLAAANADYRDYIFGTPPGSEPATSFGSAGSNILTLTFWPWPGGRIYRLQASTNLASPLWTTLTNLPAPDTNGFGYGVFTITESNGAQNFLRLSAQMSTNY